MQPSLKTPTRTSRQGWVYASLAVVDGTRQLKPAQIGPDHLLFREPPRLTSERVEIVVTNGDRQHRRLATVLPHDPEATEVPIQLLPRRESIRPMMSNIRI